VNQLIHSDSSAFSPFQKRSKLNIQNKEINPEYLAHLAQKMSSNRQAKNETGFNDISLKSAEHSEKNEALSKADNESSLYKGIVFKLKSFFGSDKAIALESHQKNQIQLPTKNSNSNSSSSATNNKANRVQSDPSETLSRMDFLDLSSNDKSSKTSSLEMRTSKSSVSTNGSRFSWQLMSNLLLPKNEKTYDTLFEIINSNDIDELKKFIAKCLPTELNYICTQKNLKDVNQQTILHYLAYYCGRLLLFSFTSYFKFN
jgi:hypothetical protein